MSKNTKLFCETCINNTSKERPNFLHKTESSMASNRCCSQEWILAAQRPCMHPVRSIHHISWSKSEELYIKRKLKVWAFIWYVIHGSCCCKQQKVTVEDWGKLSCSRKLQLLVDFELRVENSSKAVEESTATFDVELHWIGFSECRRRWPPPQTQFHVLERRDQTKWPKSSSLFWKLWICLQIRTNHNGSRLEMNERSTNLNMILGFRMIHSTNKQNKRIQLPSAMIQESICNFQLSLRVHTQNWTIFHEYFLNTFPKKFPKSYLKTYSF
jgi:hypothetical protein